MRRWFAALALVGMLWLPGYAQSPTVDDTYGFAAFWELHQAVLGSPLTAPLEEQGLQVQYFEYARLEYHPDTTPSVQVGRLGSERTRWRSFAPQPAASGSGLTPPGSQYAIRGPFRVFWEEQGGLELFGLPLSSAQWEQTAGGRYQVQYFERALMIHHPLRAGQVDEIELAPLGREVAAAHGLIEGSVPLAQAQMYAFDPVAPAPLVTEAPPEEPAAPVITPTPVPQAAPAPTATPAPAVANADGKRIAVDLSRQWLYAYEGDTQVFNAPVATGKDGFNTPTGSYRIYAKVPLQTMRGTLNGESWVVPNVPHAMYFNGSVALHGTYWHNLFGSGTRISHGCVNLPLDAAAWLYNWAGEGTPVDVSY